jgi:hypothetical protein
MYECPRCAYVCINIGDLRKHLARKNKCENTISDIAIEDIIIENCKIQNEHIKCEFCENLYANQRSMDAHVKSCLKNKTQDEIYNIVKNLRENIKEKDKIIEKRGEIIEKCNETIDEKNKIIKDIEKNKTINNGVIFNGINNGTVNNNTAITINNTIKLLSLQSTDKSHITDKFLYECISSCMSSVIKLIEKIHFNPLVPQNHNIYIRNIKSKYLLAYNGKSWLLKDRAEAIADLIIDGENMMIKFAEDEEVQKMYPGVSKKMHEYTRCINRNNNERDAKEKIRMDTTLLLYNKRDMIEETRYKLEKKRKINKNGL